MLYAKKEMFMRECALLENRDRKRLMMNKRDLHMSNAVCHDSRTKILELPNLIKK